jgi:diguanylate cyclase
MKTFRFILISLVAVCCLDLVFIVFKPGNEFVQTAVSDLLPVFCSILSIVGLATAFRGLKAWDAAKAAWLLLLCGVVLYAVAEALYGFQELFLDIKDPSASWADLFWVSGYLPFLAGLVIFLLSYRGSGLAFGDWKPVLIPALIAFVAIIALVSVFVFVPIQADAETARAAKFLYYYYPLADLAQLALVILILYLAAQFGSGAFSLPWKLIGLGLFCFAASDIAYTILDWQGVYAAGNVTDLGWNLAYLLLGLGGASQRRVLASIGEGGAR